MSSDNVTSFFSNMSHLLYTFFSIMNESEIPHNIYLYNNGANAIVFPRNFSNDQAPSNSSWHDLAGLVTARKETNESEVLESFREWISLSETAFEEMTNSVRNLISSKYLIY